jgi:hypothetical protein
MDNNTGDRLNMPIRNGDEYTPGTRPGRFVMGLATGTMLGVGIGLWLAPRTSMLRLWLDESARELGTRAAAQYGEAGVRVAAAAAEGLVSTAQSVRDGVAETVVRGANEVARVASAVKS